MPVKLEIIAGPMQGKEFTFEDHDTFVFGRAKGVHCRIEGDKGVSRHHFLLEVNPPRARVKDLGSTNGIVVNGRKYGGKQQLNASDSDIIRQRTVDLRHGDKLRVGKTVFVIHCESAVACSLCDRVIGPQDKTLAEMPGGKYLCGDCRARAAGRQPVTTASVKERVFCDHCGKDVSDEAGPGYAGTFVCHACAAGKASAKDQGQVSNLVSALLGEKPQEQMPDIPGYRIEKLLGKGGMGAVYLAQCNKSGDKVAIKVMLPQIKVSETHCKEFQREMEVTRKLRHPHIVAFLENGYANNMLYLVIEYAPQGSLEEFMDQHGGKVPAKTTLAIMLQALEGLGYAHDRGYIHRDLKPQNILLAHANGKLVAKVSDLGLAKNFEKAGMSGFTATGSFGGTPAYVPREQIMDFKRTTPVSDVFAMGATFYKMLTGECVYNFKPGTDPVNVILDGDITPLARRAVDLPKSLIRVVDRAISVNTEKRFQDAGEMLKALRHILK